MTIAITLAEKRFDTQNAQRLLLLIAIAILFPGLLFASDPLKTLQTGHPRLIIHAEDIEIARKAIVSDPYVKMQFEHTLAHAEELMKTKPEVYHLSGPEHTFLPSARLMEDRIVTLSGIYLLTGRQDFKQRAIAEMMAATSFPDWYPQHFLGTAELTAALAIGYDWLFADLDPAEKAAITQALISKSIDPWLGKIHSGKPPTPINNWIQVCNGGETLGALAIADQNPSKALEVLQFAATAVPDIMKRFAPDGGFEEGPVYWNYATVYNVLYLAALDSALGTDYNIAESKGFPQTGEYRIQSLGPNYLYANFGDALPAAFPAPQMFWMANKFKRPFYAQHEKSLTLASIDKMQPGTRFESARFQVFGIFWASLLGTPPSTTEEPPRARTFTHINQAFMRTAWNDPNAWYVAVKGGDARASHGHLDLGSFVFDADGERWAIDPGPDTYGLPDYFGSTRWTYYRMRSEAHNTLTLGSSNEDLDAVASTEAAELADHSLLATMDLDGAFKAKLKSWKRQVRLQPGLMAVEDDIVPCATANIRWNFHTRASVTIRPDGRSARLSQNGRQMEVAIVTPAAARFEMVSTQSAAPQLSNEGTYNLTINLQETSHPVVIQVLFRKASR